MRWSARRRTWRGSPSYGVRSGVRMSQNMRATPWCSGRHGSTANVLASGIAIMSDSSIALKPVIEEPSKPMPPSKASSSSATLIEKDFSWPRMSVNQKRMKRTWRSSQMALTSSGVVGCSGMRGTLEHRHWTAGRAAVDNGPMPAAASYAHGVSDVPLLGETIGANLERTVGRFGDREAVVSCHQGVRLTYAELDAAVNRIASGLLAAGIEKGERVGIWAPNCVEWVLTQFATAKVGAILVNINPAYRTHELEYALRQSGVKLLVSARAFKTSDYMAMVDEVRDTLPQLQAVVFLDGAEWDQLAATPVDDAALRERMASLAFDDPINIQYTSGTTGFPKGATLSHHNILNNGFFVGELCSYTEADRVCIPVPFYHCFGMVLGNLACTTHGACMVYPE